MYNTLTRVKVDTTSSLEGKTTRTTELCHQKCRHIQASNHDQAGILDIYDIMVGGEGRRQRESVILCSASAVSYRVTVIRKKNIYI